MQRDLYGPYVLDKVIGLLGFIYIPLGVRGRTVPLKRYAASLWPHRSRMVPPRNHASSLRVHVAYMGLAGSHASTMEPE